MNQSEPTPAIVCQNVWKIFGPRAKQIQQTVGSTSSRADILAETGHVIAVKDVSFQVEKGQTFVVMGLSGSGKSTLIRCMSRLIEPTSGQIFIEGDDVTQMKRKQLRQLRRHKVSMVFQHFGLFPHRRIIDNVAYGLEVQGMSRAARYDKATEVLNIVGLSEWAHHYPEALSGGMQQRVGIARALAVDPDILFFDEPFSALDPLIRREMQEELLNLQRVMQKTIVFITHDFLEAVKLADNLAIMRDGEIVQQGRPAEIVLNPINEYVREFTKDVPRSRLLTAQAVMRPCGVIASETESPQAVLARLQAEDYQTAFIHSEANGFLGHLSRAEIEQAAADSTCTDLKAVGDDCPTALPDTALADLIPLIAQTDHPLPVVDANQTLLGVVNRTAVMLALGE